jgi:hypothetical protein
MRQAWRCTQHRDTRPHGKHRSLVPPSDLDPIDDRLGLPGLDAPLLLPLDGPE